MTSAVSHFIACYLVAAVSCAYAHIKKVVLYACNSISAAVIVPSGKNLYTFVVRITDIHSCILV